MELAQVSETQMQAYLGDLLFHSSRVEAEVYLRKALDVDPNLLLANESLGMLRFRQGRVSDALKYLGRSIAKESKNALVHYYYASALSRPGQGEAKLSLGYSPEVATEARVALRKAMSLRPDMLEAYNLLAYVNLVTSTEIDETTALLEKVLAQSPDRIDLIYMLGQLYMHRDDYKRARPLLERVSGANVEPDVKRHTQMLLTTMTSVESQRAEREAARRARGLTPNHSETETGDASNQVIDDPSMSLREALRIPAQGEVQAQGMLVSIECEKSGLIFVVVSNGRTLRLRTADFQDIKRITFTADVQGSLTCGARKPGNHVIICYVPLQKNLAKVDGMLKSVEFVPSDFKLIDTAP
jgi:predicted Zn-dependent protease